MGYAPSDKPLLAIAVIVEHGESGGRTAAAIARYVFDTGLLAAGQRADWPLERTDIIHPGGPEV
jgi:penicillin-binding protein 2